MNDGLRALVAKLHVDELRTTESRAAFSALSIDDAVDVLVEVASCAVALMAVALRGDALGLACERRADPSAYPRPGDIALLAAMSTMHGRRGEAIDARFDVMLSRGLRAWWADPVHAVLLDAVRALPSPRRDAAVFGTGDSVAWRYLGAVASPQSAARAVLAASLMGTDRFFPSAQHHVVYGLTRLDGLIVAPITERFDARETTPCGRRLLVAALACIEAPADVCLARAQSDPNAMVRRLARDALDHRGTPAAPSYALTDEVRRVRALRASITADERAAMRAYAAAAYASRELDANARPVRDPLRALAATADLWVRTQRLCAFEPSVSTCESIMRACVIEAADQELAAALVADAWCRLAPAELDPMRTHHVLRTLPSDTLDAVARALGRMLSPEDAGNPVALYDWLAVRGVTPDAPAFVRGMGDPNPRIRMLCERAMRPRTPVAPPPWSLDVLRAAFAPLFKSSCLGSFGLFAIDHRTQTWALVSWIEGDDEDHALMRTEEAMLALTLAAPQEADGMSLAMLDALSAAGLHMRRAKVDTVALASALDRMTEVTASDSYTTTRTEAEQRIEALRTGLGASPRCVCAYDVADAAWSEAWLFQDPERAWSALVAYVNDQ